MLSIFTAMTGLRLIRPPVNGSKPVPGLANGFLVTGGNTGRDFPGLVEAMIVGGVCEDVARVCEVGTRV